jgi:branched-chain amino acid transport system substrate-binding protein
MRAEDNGEEQRMRNRSVAALATVGLVGAIALSACGSDDNKSDGGLSDGSTSTGGGATYTIAFEGPLSGDNAQLGINEVNGVQLAIDQANAKGDLGFKLQMIKADDVGDPAKAPAAAAQVIQNDNVMGVVGPSFSGATQAVGQKYGDAGIPIVNPSASNGELQTLGFKTWHRIFPNDYAEGPAAGDWLAKHAKKVFVINDLSAYGAGVAGAVVKQLKKDGITVQTAGVDAKTTDYSPISQQVVNSGAQAMFYGGYDAQGALFAKALNAAGYKGIKMAGNGVKSSVFVDGAGDAGNGWYFSCGCQDATVAPSAKQFSADYQAKFNTAPSTYSPEAFDATNILIAAIKSAAAAGTVTRQAVNDAVNKTDYDGITGHITFSSDGDLPLGQGTVNLYTEKGGKIISLGDITQAK